MSESSQPVPVVVYAPPARQGLWAWRIAIALLAVSVIFNAMLFGVISTYFSNASGSAERYRDGMVTSTDKIAVLRMVGFIAAETIGSIKRELKQAADDPGIKAVVLAIESPGGTIAGSDELYQEIVNFKATGKKLVVSMQGLATSGGYYIAVPADRIVADRSCITGSIGVIASLFTVAELMEKIGVKSEVVKSGALKDAGSPFRPFGEQDRAEMTAIINAMYRQFEGVVLKHRGDKIEGGAQRLAELAGRVVIAEQAVQLGLIDAIGYEADAIDTAKTLAGLTSPARIVEYERPVSLLSFLGVTASSPGTGVIESALSRRAMVHAIAAGQPLLVSGPAYHHMIAELLGQLNTAVPLTGR